MQNLPNAQSVIMQGFASRAQTPTARDDLTMRTLSSEDADEKFRKGLAQFNCGRFFDAHETWEEIWLSAPDPEKTFLQGIIQVAAAFHHYSRGNREGTRSLLAAGLRKLDQFPSNHRGLKLEELRAAMRRWLAALEAGNSPGREEFPQIGFVQGAPGEAPGGAIDTVE